MTTKEAVEQARTWLARAYTMNEASVDVLTALLTSVEQFDNTVRKEQSEEAAIVEAARETYAVGSDDDVEVDDNAMVTRIFEEADEHTSRLTGAWVQAWVWVNGEDIAKETA